MLFHNRKDKSKINEKIITDTLKNEGYKNVLYHNASISYTNDVVCFEYNSIKYYLKFFTDQWCDINAGENEIESINLLSSKGIEVPQIITFRKNTGYRNYCITKQVNGKILKEIPKENFSFSNITKIVKTIELMQQITGKFGFIHHNEKIHQTYSNHFDFINDTVIYGLKKLKDFNFNVEDMLNTWKELRVIDSIEKNYVFTHNDITPKHIFVSEQSIGLIDFEWSCYSVPMSDYALLLFSLGEYGFNKENLESLLSIINTKDTNKTLPYLVARIFILAAAWPHKNVNQPYYSQTCLNKANKIISKNNLEVNDLIWYKGIGLSEIETCL